MSERLSRLCAYALEGGLLLMALLVPAYFNINDLRIFEPDKAILLRDLVAALGALALLRLALLALATAQRAAPRKGKGLPHLPAAALPRTTSPLRAAVRGALRRPTLLPMLLLAGVTLLATATSILPALSWAGSYARGQGALTTLAYLTAGLLVLGTVRRPAQVHRLAAAVALSGVAPAAYGWVQHFGHDPLPWQQPDLTARVPGTLGNPIFLGALLVMTLPLALYRLALTLSTASAPARDDATEGSVPLRIPHLGARFPMLARRLRLLGWSAVVAIEAGGLFFTKSRGPAAGLLVALVVLGLGLSHIWCLRWLRRGSAALGLAAVLVLGASNVLAPSTLRQVPGTSALRLLQWTPQASGTSEVRLLIWRPALDLIARRPLLGCGPDALQYCYYPVYPTALRHIEAPNAVPDRTHDILLDAATETGLLGLAALLGLLAVTARGLARLAARAGDPARRALAAALLAALAGHVAEGLVGIAIVATTLLTWLIAGLAGALVALEEAAPRPQPATDANRRRPAWRLLWERIPLPFSLMGRMPGVATFALAPAADSARSPRAVASPTPAAAASTRWTDLAPGQRKRVERAAARRARRYARLAAPLAAIGCVAASVAAWQVIVTGLTATAADAAARQGADLEMVALANSGQAPLPPGRLAQPILGLRQFSAAASAQDVALHLAPDQQEYALDAGRTLVEWGDAAGAVGGPAAVQASTLYERALLDFGRAAHLNPYDPDPLRDTGKAYERWAGLGHNPAAPATWDQGALDRAAQAFARAARLAPRHPDPLTSWAQVALWQGRTQQALNLANRALALDARDGDGYRLRAEAEVSLGEGAQALADWRRALADPDVAQRGPLAAHLALAEATWAHARCAAVRDARMSLAAGDAQDTTQMREILHVGGPRCPGA